MDHLDLPDCRADRTISQLLQMRASQHPDKVYAAFADAEFTYGALHDAAMAYARAYIAMGVKPGDHVATLMPNCASWLPAYYGALYAGAAVVALNARYKTHELTFTLAHSNARVLVTTDLISDFVEFTQLIGSALPSLADATDETALDLPEAPSLRAMVLCNGAKKPGFLTEADFLSLGSAIDENTVSAAMEQRFADDTAAIIYTSGTTSMPKGCELTHASIQNSWQTFSSVVGLRPDEVVWTPMPFFHTGGIGPITTVLANGATFVSQPHYDADGVVDLITRYRVNHLYAGFPQIAFPVLEHPRFDREAFGFVRSMLNVGPPAMQRRIQDLLPEGARLVNLFGMTEGSGIITFTPIDAPYQVRAETSGLPPKHTDLRIADPETGLDCPTGSEGEIHFRGGGAFKGYYRDPQATAATITPEGWVSTGDRGKINGDGQLVYLGRLKDMLKVGGENVAAAEIEAFLQCLPEVRLAQVIGVADERMGEVPVAFVETMPHTTISADAIIAACQGQLARWKIPRHIFFVDEWPMSATKVQKFKLVDRLPQALRDA